MSALKPKLYTLPRCGWVGEKAAMIPIQQCVLGDLGKCTLNTDVCFATVSAGLPRSQPVSNSVSDRLYSDSWTSPLEEIGSGLTKVTHSYNQV